MGLKLWLFSHERVVNSDPLPTAFQSWVSSGEGVQIGCKEFLNICWQIDDLVADVDVSWVFSVGEIDLSWSR